MTGISPPEYRVARHRVARHRVGTLCCVVLAVAAVTAAASDWPGFLGGPRAAAGSGAPPLRWSVEEGGNVLWRTPIPGLGHSSPVVWGDRVFVTTAVAQEEETYTVGLSEDLSSAPARESYDWRVYCLDRASGAVRWERTLRSGAPRSRRHLKNSFATPTPVTDGRVLVVSFGSHGLYALDLDGDLRWQTDLGRLGAGHYADPTLEWGYGSSPLLYRDLVIVQADLNAGSFVAAYRLADGSLAWRTARDAEDPSWSTPAILPGPAGDELVTNAPNAVRGYDPASGEELWWLPWKQEIVISTPTVVDGVAYVASGKGDRQPILALRPGARGELRWSADAGPEGQLADFLLWGRGRGGAIVPSPLVHDGYLYSLFDLGILRCFDAASGELVYQHRLPGSYLASPVAADGRLYLASEDGHVAVVRAGPEFELLALNPMTEPLLATPALSGDVILVRGLHHVFALGEAPRSDGEAATPTSDPADPSQPTTDPEGALR